MEAIKSLSLENVRRQVEISPSVSSASKNRTAISDNSGNIEKQKQNAQQVKETTNDKINRIAEAMDNYVQSVQRNLKIQVHEDTGNIMVRVTSQDNGKIIREIPPKELLDLAARMEEMAGTLFDEKV